MTQQILKTGGRQGKVCSSTAVRVLSSRIGASSMYVPGKQGAMEIFHVGSTPAALGLAIYVIGYGFGPLLWAPLIEIASI